MEIKNCNIVELIENNPITKLSNDYNIKLLVKIKEQFTEFEQQLFLSSFYCYFNYHPTNDYVIDLDNIWKWLGFTQKIKAKKLLEKYFVIDKDYKKSLCDIAQQSIHTKGGHNKEIFMLNIKTFKLFCIKAETKKADEIHEYFLKMEQIIQEVVHEESNELKNQLQIQTKQLENHIINSEKSKDLLREKTILEQFSDNTQCVYYGIIDNTNSTNDKLVKFGNSNFLRDRVDKHKRTFNNFRLINAFKVENKIQIENAIKKNPIINQKRTCITIDNGNHIVNHTEILIINDFSFEKLDKLIKNIIISVEYSPDNYKKILKENEKINKNTILLSQEIEYLKLEIENMKSKKTTIDNITNNNNIEEENKKLIIKLLLLEEENQKLKIDNHKFIKRYKLDKTIDIVNLENSTEFVNDVEYNEIITSMKRIAKSSDGLYHINNKTYKKCFGSRQDVWNENAYKTTGELIKSDLIINKEGKIISKQKFILEKSTNRFKPKSFNPENI